MSTTGLTIVTDALAELNVFAAGDTIPPDDADFVLRKMNRVIDLWNADGASSYGDSFTSYTLTPALQPHTIGPTGTFAVATPPEVIDGANYITGTGTSAVRIPIAIRDRFWWANESVQAITSSIPTDLYYAKGATNGSIYLWPVPSAASTLELMVRRLLTQLTLVSTFALPQGYQEALTLTVAEAIAPAYEQQPSPSLARSAAKARAILFASNRLTPRLHTQDAGMPGGCGGSRVTYLNRLGT